MKTPQQLKEARAERVDALDSLVNFAKAEERDNTPEENTRADEIVQEIEDLDKQIERAEKVTAALKAKAVPVTMGSSKSEEREIARHARDYSLTKAIQETQTNQLQGLEREKEEAIREFREAGISPSGTLQIPIAMMEARAVATTSSATSNVTGEVAQGVLQGLVPDAVLERAGANRITGVAGDVLLPSLPSDATQIAAETTALANVSAMSGIKISPVKMGSRIDISQQALAMSGGAFDAVVAAQFRRHSGALIDQQFIENVIANSGTQMLRKEAATAAVGGLTFANVNGLVGKVGDANGISPSSAFFGSYASMAEARVTEAVSGSGVGILVGDEIVGYKAHPMSVANAARLTDASFDVASEVFAAAGSVTALDNEATLEPFLFANMADTYVCYWGGADLIVDQFSAAHTGVTRLIMNVYANANTGHAGSAAFFATDPA
jgi:HK97 family phage major capsid protein